ncbi:MAG: uracil-DNA glycosylase family protein, partial [Pseudomonadota bacterium]
MDDSLQSYATRLRACTLCKGDMPNDPNPIFQVSDTARILIASQAPGNLAHQSGKPFDDPSGRRLRDWMGVTEEEFYDASRVAIAPMGFCFPGYDKHGGDLPPMKRCAPEWRAGLLGRMPQIKVILLIGGYSQKWHLGERAKKSLTATVEDWRRYLSEGMFTTP